MRLQHGWFTAQRRICPAAALAIGGEHNASNALAAIAVARAWGVGSREITSGLRSFPGLAYRQQAVATLNGVSFINDSAATSPDATIAALRRFGHAVVLIAGGADKRFPLTEIQRLAQAVGKGTHAVILFAGSGSDRLAQALRAYPRLAVSRGLTTMADAVALARAYARRGDVILLSPGFASFGLFQHEFERGEQFAREVKSQKAKVKMEI